MLDDPLTQGFFLGLLFSGILAYLSFLLHIWKKGVSPFFKPQTVVLTTKKTPAEVFGQMIKTIIILVVLLVGTVYLIIHFYP